MTGAAKRVGAVIAHQLHRRGYTVAIHHHNSATEAEQLCSELNRQRAQSAFTLRQDLGTETAAQELVAQLGQQTAGLDLLVNSASVFDATPLAECSIQGWNEVQAINARAPYFVSLACLPLLQKQRGSIVNISDIHAAHPRQSYSLYCISKATLVAVTQALAVELAPEVRVNAVAPGAILWADNEDSNIRGDALAATPMQRCGDPGDIAEAVIYLAEASYVTGEIIAVDGGRRLSV